VNRVKSFCEVKLEEQQWVFLLMGFFANSFDEEEVVMYRSFLNEGTLARAN
jgi:hypothetical protein